MTTANKILSTIPSNSTDMVVYLDGAAELSKIDRKNHHQVSEKGVPLVYDYMVTVSTPSKRTDADLEDQVTLTGVAYTVPNNWQTRNAVRMTHFTREELRRESGVTKGAIGKYAKTLRLNMDPDMQAILYRPAADLPAFESAALDPDLRVMRVYAEFNPGTSAPYNQVALQTQFTGGVWDYTQLAQVENDDANTADPFYVNVLGNHSANAPGPYTYIGAIQAYNQRRQTVLDDSTVTPGGDTQFVNNESPFFRVPQQDVSEDAYVDITLDEQDNPPYDRRVGQVTPSIVLADSIRAQAVEYFQTTMSNSMVSFRVQAPLGLLKLDFSDLFGTGWNPINPGLSAWTTVQNILLEVECLGTYEM